MKDANEPGSSERSTNTQPDTIHSCAHTHMHTHILASSLYYRHIKDDPLHIQYVCIRTPSQALNLPVHCPSQSSVSEFVWRGRHLTLSCHPAKILSQIASPIYGSLFFFYREQLLGGEELSHSYIEVSYNVRLLHFDSVWLYRAANCHKIWRSWLAKMLLK